MSYKVIVYKDGERVFSKSYKTERGAKSAYERFCDKLVNDGVERIGSVTFLIDGDVFYKFYRLPNTWKVVFEEGDYIGDLD